MSRKNTLSLIMSVCVLFFVGMTSAIAATETKATLADRAELFGLPFNNLSLRTLEKQLNGMGLSRYPSYRDDMVSYSLGEEGILGVTNADIFINNSGYVRQALLSGVIDDNKKRRDLGNLLEKKYGVPIEGALSGGIGRAKWLFDDATTIEFRNTTYDVSIMYVDQRPSVTSFSGKIDVEALSRKNQ